MSPLVPDPRGLASPGSALDSPLGSPVGAPGERPRFLSEADGHDIARRLARYAVGGGYTVAYIVSTWRGNVRWGRNLINTSGDVRNNHITLERSFNGERNYVMINQISDEALVAATRRAERLVIRHRQQQHDIVDILKQYQPEPVATPQLFSEATYQLDAERRAEAARQLAQSAATAGMLSAGYIEVMARSMACITSWGVARYVQYTWAQYSVTVRDPTGTGSGWAGVDWPEWNRIDGPTLSAIALDKCVKSRNPVAVEPGRYMTILEPQAVCDFTVNLIDVLGRTGNEDDTTMPFHQATESVGPGMSKLAERVVDERISISADPMDPDLGFLPFIVPVDEEEMTDKEKVFHAVKWIEHGVLTNLAYDRHYALKQLGRDTGLPNSGAFRMSGGETSIEEMIATTKRGLLVTRFDQVQCLDDTSLLCLGYTRDGLWLIEDGKISKPVKNMMFTESVLFALNNVQQLGVPQRAFHPPHNDYEQAGIFDYPAPVIVPPLKIRDFNFTALDSAV